MVLLLGNWDDAVLVCCGISAALAASLVEIGAERSFARNGRGATRSPAQWSTGSTSTSTALAICWRSLAISGGASRRDAAEDFNARFKSLLSDSISSFEPGYPLRLFLEPPGDPGRPFLELPLDVDVEISPNTARKSASRVRSSSKAAQSSAVVSGKDHGQLHFWPDIFTVRRWRLVGFYGDESLTSFALEVSRARFTHRAFLHWPARSSSPPRPDSPRAIRG